MSGSRTVLIELIPAELTRDLADFFPDLPRLALGLRLLLRDLALVPLVLFALDFFPGIVSLLWSADKHNFLAPCLTLSFHSSTVTSYLNAYSYVSNNTAILEYNPQRRSTIESKPIYLPEPQTGSSK